MTLAPNLRFFLFLACAFAAHAEDPGPAPKVTKLDGTSILGVVEITDDYTIRIKSDSGIQNIPIARLGDSDFRKYGLSRDRSKDGRLWSERKDALEDEKKTSKKSDPAAIEIRLAELAPFQPLIAAYESKNPKKNEPAENEKSEKPGDPTKMPEKSSTLHMFTGPGSLNIPTVPFASSAASAVMAPATTAVSSIPGVPGVPSAPVVTPP